MRRKARKKVTISLVGILLMGVIGVVIYTRWDTNKGIKAEYHLKYNIDYNSLTYKVDIDSVNYLDKFMINQEDFLKVKQEDIKNDLKNVKVVLGDNLYRQMIRGLDSKYFKGYSQNEYTKVYNVIQNLAGNISAIDELYKEADRPKLVKKCVTDDCEINNYIKKYTKGKVKQLLLESHEKYETLINLEKLSKKDESNIDKMAGTLYLEDLCKNKEYIEGIEIEIKIIPSEEYKANKKTNNYNKITITNKNSKVLDYLALYKCYNFYDEALGLNKYRNEIAIKNNKKKYKRVTTFSLCGLNDKDSFRIEYEIIDCKHKVKQYSDCEKELQEKSRIHFQEKKLMEKIEKKKEENEKLKTDISEINNINKNNIIK